MRVQTGPFGAFASRNAGYDIKHTLRSESYLQPQRSKHPFSEALLVHSPLGLFTGVLCDMSEG